MLFLLDGNPLLNTCFDLNHLLIESNIDFIRAVGSRIITLHVSDFDYIDECHLLPLEGKTDWTSIFRELEKVGYNGRFMYEVYGRGKHTLSELPENKKTLDRLYQDKKQWLTLG